MDTTTILSILILALVWSVTAWFLWTEYHLRILAESHSHQLERELRALSDQVALYASEVAKRASEDAIEMVIEQRLAAASSAIIIATKEQNEAQTETIETRMQSHVDSAKACAVEDAREQAGHVAAEVLTAHLAAASEVIKSNLKEEAALRNRGRLVDTTLPKIRPLVNAMREEKMPGQAKKMKVVLEYLKLHPGTSMEAVESAIEAVLLEKCKVKV